MALAMSDLPAGTKIEKQGYVRDADYVASYEREFEIPLARLGGSTLVAVFESLSVDRTPAQARSKFGLLALLLKGKRGKTFVRNALVSEGLDPKGVVVGKVRRPKIGHGTVSVPIRITEQGITFQTTMVFARFDRVLAGLFVLGLKVRTADMDRLTRVALARVFNGLVPLNTTQPTVSGVAQPGQTLTAAKGTWTGDELTFAYQWERCDAAGMGCAAVPGATGTTYSTATGDLASTLRVRVTGRNRLGSVVNRSNPTAAVAGPPGSPVSTGAPAVSGTPQAGATLTASTGSWSGDPTAFAYQWRRCDAAGGACVDIAGATAATYAVASTDSRATLRVLVVATNAAGPGGAISAPTAAVP